MFWLTRHGKKVQFSSAWEKLCWSQHLENGRNFNCNSHDIICITTRCFATRAAWGRRCTTLAKNAEREKLEEEFVLIAPSWENFNFHTCWLKFWSWKIIVRSSSQLTWSENRCPFEALQLLFSDYSRFYLHRKAPGKVPWNWLALVSRLHDTSIMEAKKKITNFNGQ